MEHGEQVGTGTTSRRQELQQQRSTFLNRHEERAKFSLQAVSLLLGFTLFGAVQLWSIYGNTEYIEKCYLLIPAVFISVVFAVECVVIELLVLAMFRVYRRSVWVEVQIEDKEHFEFARNIAPSDCEPGWRKGGVPSKYMLYATLKMIALPWLVTELSKPEYYHVNKYSEAEPRERGGVFGLYRMVFGAFKVISWLGTWVGLSMSAVAYCN